MFFNDDGALRNSEVHLLKELLAHPRLFEALLLTAPSPDADADADVDPDDQPLPPLTVARVAITLLNAAMLAKEDGQEGRKLNYDLWSAKQADSRCNCQNRGSTLCLCSLLCLFLLVVMFPADALQSIELDRCTERARRGSGERQGGAGSRRKQQTAGGRQARRSHLEDCGAVERSSRRRQVDQHSLFPKFSSFQIFIQIKISQQFEMFNLENARKRSCSRKESLSVGNSKHNERCMFVHLVRVIVQSCVLACARKAERRRMRGAVVQRTECIAV